MQAMSYNNSLAKTKAPSSKPIMCCLCQGDVETPSRAPQRHTASHTAQHRWKTETDSNCLFGTVPSRSLPGTNHDWKFGIDHIIALSQSHCSALVFVVACCFNLMTGCGLACSLSDCQHLIVPGSSCAIDHVELR